MFNSNILSSFPISISYRPKFLSSSTYFSLAYRSSKYSFLILPSYPFSLLTSNSTVDISSWASSSYFFIFFICPLFSLRASLYLINCWWISAPGCLAKIFLSSRNNFSFSRIRFSFSSTSYVFAINLLSYYKILPLESLNFQNTFIILLVSSLKFSPTVDIHWVFELIFQSFNLSLMV